MDRLSKGIIAVGIILALTTSLYLHFFIPQYNFLSKEIQAVKMSSPIQIKEFLVFGTGLPIFSIIPENNFISFFGTSNLSVLYNGFYVPTYEVMKDKYYISTPLSLGDYLPSVIGQKVYLSFIDTNINPSVNVSAPYIIKSENIQGNEVIWNLSFNGNISNAITFKNITLAEGRHFVDGLNGVILPNGIVLLSPASPFIDNGFVSFVPFPFSDLFEIDIGIAFIFIILIAVKIKRKIKKSDKNEREH